MAGKPTDHEVEQFVYRSLASFGPELSKVTRSATLEDLDIDSLDLVELGQMVEEEYGVRFKAEDFKDVEDVGGAVDVIASRLT